MPQNLVSSQYKDRFVGAAVSTSGRSGGHQARPGGRVAMAPVAAATGPVAGGGLGGGWYPCHLLSGLDRCLIMLLELGPLSSWKSVVTLKFTLK